MKTIQSLAAAALLVLTLTGCARPTDPAFSPDGSTLVFERSGELILRHGGSERRISPHVEGMVAWSPDGKQLAFTGRGGTTILDVTNGRAVRTPNLAGPYFWQEGSLYGTLENKSTKKLTFVAVDPQSGTPSLHADLSFFPTEIAALSRGGAIMWDGYKAYRFDGIAASRLPQLDAMMVVAPGDGPTELALAKTGARPHTHHELIWLYDWNYESDESPKLTATLDPHQMSGTVSDFATLASLKASRHGGRMAAVILTGDLTSQADRTRVAALVDKYDLLNWDQTRKDMKMSKADEKFLRDVGSRMKSSAICVAGSRNGRWNVVAKVSLPKEAKGLGLDMKIALDDEGTKLAVVTNGKARIYTLTR